MLITFLSWSSGYYMVRILSGASSSSSISSAGTSMLSAASFMSSKEYPRSGCCAYYSAEDLPPDFLFDLPRG